MSHYPKSTSPLWHHIYPLPHLRGFQWQQQPLCRATKPAAPQASLLIQEEQHAAGSDAGHHPESVQPGKMSAHAAEQPLAPDTHTFLPSIHSLPHQGKNLSFKGLSGGSASTGQTWGLCASPSQGYIPPHALPSDSTALQSPGSSPQLHYPLPEMEVKVVCAVETLRIQGSLPLTRTAPLQRWSPSSRNPANLPALGHSAGSSKPPAQ